LEDLVWTNESLAELSCELGSMGEDSGSGEGSGSGSGAGAGAVRGHSNF